MAMGHDYRDYRNFQLPFRQDELARSTLADVHHALAVLEHAAAETYDLDMRTDSVFEAVEFLKEPLRRHRPVNDFRDALSVENPAQRKRAVDAALAGIRSELRCRGLS
jgi:hypothetical protein